MDTADRLIEQHLVLRCQIGDREAFHELIQRVDAPLRYVVRRLVRNDSEAADVVQEVWLTALRRIRRLSHPEAFRAWLYRIAHSAAVDAFRRGSARQRAEQAYVAERPDEIDPPPGEMDVRNLHAAIGRLDEKHREVVLLMLIGELTVEEIASVLSVPAGTVKSRMHHARQQLRTWMGGRDE
jgi:RNA polymerase sigma-70 factor (ECF subfamily)